MIVDSTVYSGADQRKHQGSASLAFVRGIHRWPVNSPHKWPVTRKMFPFDEVIMVELSLMCLTFSADDSFQDFMNTFSIVQHTGDVLWMFPAVVKTYCTLDVRHFPFDRQKCNIIFISWTFNGFKMNITDEPGFANGNKTIYYTPKNQEWYVDRISVIRRTKVYACCPEPYPDVCFTIHMTRRLVSSIKTVFPGIGIPILKMGWSWDRRIFIMGVHISTFALRFIWQDG